jgi:hypothetical protein
VNVLNKKKLARKKDYRWYILGGNFSPLPKEKPVKILEKERSSI